MAGLALPASIHCAPWSKGKPKVRAVGDRTPADAIARLDHQHVLVRRHQGACRGKPGDAGADDDDIEVGGMGRSREAERRRCRRHQQAAAVHSFQVKGKSCWRTKPGGM